MFTEKVSETQFDRTSKTAMLNSSKNNADKSKSEGDILSELERSRLKMRLTEEKDKYLNKPDSELSENYKLMKELATIYTKNDELINRNRVLENVFKQVKDDNEQLEESINDFESDIGNLTETNNQYCIELEQRENELIKKEDSIKNLHKEIRSRDDKYSDMVYSYTLKMNSLYVIIVSMALYILIN